MNLNNAPVKGLPQGVGIELTGFDIFGTFSLIAVKSHGTNHSLIHKGYIVIDCLYTDYTSTRSDNH